MKARNAALHALVAALALSLVPVPSPADPPPWAPAHGWRKKHDPNYVGYTGRKWERDYGVVEGHCNTAAVGAVLGGAVGGVVGSQVGRGEERAVAIILGTAIGAVIGAKVGRDLDQADRACMGHALELAGDGRTVAWSNDATGVSYRLTPARGHRINGVPCREFTTDVSAGARKDVMKGVACRRADGAWELRG